MSTSEYTCSLMVKPPSPTLAGRFVDRDMFVRYRGGGVGHKYMREIEVKYENMSIERDHWDSRPKPPRDNNVDTNMDTNTAGNDDEGPEDPKQPGNLEGDSRDQGPSGSQGVGADGDKPDDGDGVPPESGNSSDDCSMGCNEDSGDDEPGVFEEDPDEIGSDVGYESYGLADP